MQHPAIPTTMKAVVTTGNGGFDKLIYRDVPVPVPGPAEVLVQVLAAGVNNTEINTRLGWYSSSVEIDTASFASAQEAKAEAKADGGWNAATPFPLIQGTDCCGTVLIAEDMGLIGRRVLVRPCIRPHGFGSLENIWIASDFDGAFAQYVKVPASEVFPVDSPWSDAELGSIPCAYGTAENMVHRAGVKAGDHVIVTGGSGGVGSATIQLVKRRGARVTAISSPSKAAQLREIGADAVIGRDDSFGGMTADVVIDNVAGPAFGSLIQSLVPGGRYASSGAIGGPMVGFDMRDFYLRDLTLIGCTRWDEPVFPNLVGYVERNEIRPLVAKVLPLADIVEAQKAFLAKAHVGKFVLIPPQPDAG